MADNKDSSAKKQKVEEEKAGSSDQGMDVVKGGWFTELSTMWPGQGMSLKVKDVLFRGKSDFQDICVFESESFGRVLVLDGALPLACAVGCIQVTDRDECSYQEMMVHVAMTSLADEPKKVLCVGGGDGGVARELARYACLQEIHQAEIDGMVCNTSKRFFPAMAVGFSDPRVQLHICDGIKYVQDAEEGSFDFIVVDSSDPVGPAELLFERPFFEALHRALKPGGMICTQAECQWLHMPIIKALAAMCADIFKGGSVSYGVTQTPTYPCGQIGMMVCAKAGPNGEVADPRKAVRPPPGAVPSLGIPDLKYYTPDVHAAAFALPKFTADALNGSLTFQ